jgi:hypothetical protein
MVIHLWGRCPSRIGFRFGSLAAALLGLSLFLSPAVLADSTPYPARLEFQGLLGNYVYPGPSQLGFTNETDACKWVVGHYTTAIFTSFSYDGPPGTGYSQGYCFATYPTSSGEGYFGFWKRNAECLNGGQADGGVAQPMCSCPAGWMFPPGSLVYGRPPCVPDTTPSCPIDPIPPYTPDPYPALIEELTPRMQTALSCLQTAIGAQGGKSSFNSGYRPVPYNDHLRAVWDKWEEVRNEKRPECQARRAEVAAEIALHEMIKEPALSSNHSLREAVDLSSNLPRGTLDGLAINCGLFRPLPLTDKPHFEPRR